MSPKKKKPAPAVVGTVSTRSTRRESIINVEIVPRSYKTSKKSTKKLNKNVPSEDENLKEVEASMEARPEILEILKEWSDDDNSLSANTASDASSLNNIPVDQQCLIDILEGKPQTEDSTISVELTEDKQKNDKVTSNKDLAVDNPIVNIDSPKVEEPDIIEECVVEDDSFIIELTNQSANGCVDIEGTSTEYKVKVENENVGEVKIELTATNDEVRCFSSVTVVDTPLLENKTFSEKPQNEEDISDNPQSKKGSIEAESKSETECLKVGVQLDLEEAKLCQKIKEETQIPQQGSTEFIEETVEQLSENLEYELSKISLSKGERLETCSLVEKSPSKGKHSSPSIKKDTTNVHSDKEKSSKKPSCEVKRKVLVDGTSSTNSMDEQAVSKVNKEAEVLHCISSSDMDSENSETKSFGMETDSVSNESSREVTSDNSSGKTPADSDSGTAPYFPPRETKIAECWVIKKPSRKTVFTRTCSSKLKLVEDTIDEVLRRYTCEEDTPDKGEDDKPQGEVVKNDEPVKQPLNESESSSSQQHSADLSNETVKSMQQLSLGQNISSSVTQQSSAVLEGKVTSKTSSSRKSSFSQLPGSARSASKSKSKEGKTKIPKEQKKKKSKSKNGENSEEVRRSDRIKTIAPVKKKSRGLVRSKSEPNLEIDNSDSNSMHTDIEKPSPTASPRLSKSDKKSKSKSTGNLESLMPSSPDLPKPSKKHNSGKAEIEARLKTFVHLKENSYKTDRQTCKEAKEMVCDCYLAEEDIQKNEFGCGDDCLNRLLMIECGDLCQVGTRCTNRRFQRGLFAPVEVFKTEKKGLGLRAAANIAYGEFILEYVGEVLNPDEFDKRAEVYSKDKNIHFYFMSLRADAIIDATMKGNISRFINHSCDPNAETQKWTVNGELRIGFFSTRTILAGEEVTFDYRFQRYGKEAQKCYCEAPTCRGWLGDSPNESEDEDEEEEDEDEEEAPKVPITPETPKTDLIIPPEPQLKDELAPEAVKMDVDTVAAPGIDLQLVEQALPAVTEETPKKAAKKKVRKEVLYEEIDQLNEDIDMLGTTGLKNQAHTLKLSRLMVRAKDLTQRKKLLRVLRRGELPCRRLFLDYHGLRLMHGYMIDAQQLKTDKPTSSFLEIMQTKLELLQTLAVLPIQNKTMLIESKVLPAVEKWAKNEDIVEDNDQKEERVSRNIRAADFATDPEAKEKIEEIKFLAAKLLEEWANMKEIFRIPKKQRIEQMKEHEKEANRKYNESNSQERDSSRKNDQRYRTWSRCKSERETSKRGSRPDDRPSAEFLKISKHERRKLFALQMELREEERRMKQRELWRQHELNCMLIGADPRFTAPFDPSKGFQYIWNPSLGQWQALPVPSSQSSGHSTPGTPKPSVLGPFASPLLNASGSIPGTTSQYPGIQPTLPPMVPGLSQTLANPVPGVPTSLPGSLSTSVHGLSAQLGGLAGPLPGIVSPALTALPIFQETKEDPSQVKFAGPIPPPAKLPPKWRCAKDKYGRPYYYHVKIRRSQWEPPPLPEPVEESASDSTSSETSSSSSSSSGSSSETDSDDEIDDNKLLMEVRRQIDNTAKLAVKSPLPDYIKKEGSDSITPSPEIKMESDDDDSNGFSLEDGMSEPLSSIDIRLKEQFNLDSPDLQPRKKKRAGLCQEIIISPRTEEARLQSKEDIKRYKATKEKLKRQKEQLLLQAKKKLKSTPAELGAKKPKDKKQKSTGKTRTKDSKEWNDEHAKKIKEVFRSTMATTVVGVLNAYRKPDCREARITNTEDFKHLARKLTHFVMLKEIKHIATIDELVCTDNVKGKAREYIRKYMSKFGEVYQKRQDEPDFKD